MRETGEENQEEKQQQGSPENDLKRSKLDAEELDTVAGGLQTKNTPYDPVARWRGIR